MILIALYYNFPHAKAPHFWPLSYVCMWRIWRRGEGGRGGEGGGRGQLFFSSDYEVGLEVSFTLLAYWLFSLSTKGNKATSNWLHQCQLLVFSRLRKYLFGQEYNKSMAAWTENHGRCRRCYELISGLSASYHKLAKNSEIVTLNFRSYVTSRKFNILYCDRSVLYGLYY